MRDRRGVSNAGLAAILAVALFGGLYAYDVFTCDGNGACESVPCSGDSPCGVEYAPGEIEECVLGSMCTNEGTLCEDHWGFADCTCTTVRGARKGSCRAQCAKSSDQLVE
jgi:hypothetical protein